MIALDSLIILVSSLPTAASSDWPPAVAFSSSVGDVVERLGHGHVEHDVRAGDALARRHGAELELVAGEGERAGAVAVAGVARQRRQHRRRRSSRMPPCFVLLAPPFSICSKMSVQHVAEEDRDDRRRGFVGAQAMIVAGAGDGRAQQALRTCGRRGCTAAQNTRNWTLSCGVSPGFEQVVAEVVAQRPVEVLARAVDAGERLLVQQAARPYFGADALQRHHDHHLMVGGDVGVLEDRRDLVLARRDFVVPRLDRHAELVQLALGLQHAGEHALGNRAEVLIFELLALRRLGAEQRAAGVDQVGPREVEVAVDQEVFLLRAARS